MKKSHIPYQHQRGNIQDNAIAALIRDPLFHCRVEMNKKGKGSYRRVEKHKSKGWEPVISLVVAA